MAQPARNLGTVVKQDVIERHLFPENTRTRLETFLSENEMSLEDFARRIEIWYGAKAKGRRKKTTGLSPGTIRNLLAHNPNKVGPEPLEKLATRIDRYLDHVHGKHATEIRTDLKAYQTIEWALTQAHQRGKFVVVIGPSGIGKSLTARHYSNSRTIGGMIYVEVFPGWSPKDFLKALGRELGLQTRGTTGDLAERVRSDLVQNPRLIVIDEANYLRPIDFARLVYFWNAVPNGFGIILMGTVELYEIMRSQQLQRVDSRTYQIVLLPGPTREEIARILVAEFGEENVTPQVVDVAKKYITNYRVLMDTLCRSVKELLAQTGMSLADAFEAEGPRITGDNGR